MLKPVWRLKRFNAKTEFLENRKTGHIVWEYYSYQLCDELSHFQCTVFTVGRGKPNVKRLGPCDKSCENHKTVNPESLPWEVQEAFDIKEPVPKGFILVHQRFGLGQRPYFKIYLGGDLVCPAVARESYLLAQGDETIVMERGYNSKYTRVFAVWNFEGKPQSSLKMRFRHQASMGDKIPFILHDQELA